MVVVAYGIYNAYVGTIKITGGTIDNCNWTGDSTANRGIYNARNGTIEIIDGTIISTTCGIENNGFTIIRGGTVNCRKGSFPSYGIRNNGSIEITGGTVTSSASKQECYGIYNENNGNFIIGNQEEMISSLNPIIESNKIGIYGTRKGASNIKIYNGIIKAPVSIEVRIRQFKYKRRISVDNRGN